MYRNELYNHYRLKFDDGNNEIAINTYRGWSSIYRKLFAEYLPENRKSNILELGGGYGFFLYFLKEEGFNNCLGIDISKESIDVAKQNGIDNIDYAELQDFLIGKSKMYDVIVAIDVLEHFEKNEVFLLLQRIYESLKGGGILLLQVPNGNYPFGLIYQYGDFTHETIFSPNSMRQILSVVGFKNILVKPCDNYLLKRIPTYQYLIWRMIRKIISFYIRFETNPQINILSPNFIAVGHKTN